MASYFLGDGRFALGVLIGLIGGMLALLGLDFFSLIPFQNDVYVGTILGALIAGLIGVVGQLLVILEAGRSREKDEKAGELASLHSIFAKVLRSFNTLIQLKMHLESLRPFDNIAFEGRPTLMKPVMFSDSSIHFTEAELVAPLRFDESRLFMLMNEYHDMMRNYENLHRLYSARMEMFTDAPQDEKTLFQLDEKLVGVGEVSIKDYHILKDLQENIIATVYPAVVHAADILSIVSERLQVHHKKRLSYSAPFSTDQLHELRESLAPRKADDIGEN